MDTVRAVASIDSNVGPGLMQGDPEVYYQKAKKSAKPDIQSFIDRFGIRHKRILSIASGYGAEEDLFAELGDNMVVCIEPDPEAVEVHRRHAHKNVEIRLTSLIGSGRSATDFDVVYTSSPSDWMMQGLFKVIPKEYLDVLQSASSPCIFIVRFYGGNYRTAVLKSAWFRIQLARKLESVGFKLAEYWMTQDPRDKNNSTMIAMRGEIHIRKEFPIITNRVNKVSVQLSAPPPSEFPS